VKKRKAGSQAITGVEDYLNRCVLRVPKGYNQENFTLLLNKREALNYERGTMHIGLLYSAQKVVERKGHLTRTCFGVESRSDQHISARTELLENEYDFCVDVSANRYVF
jgi:hypothetical protein